jgi:hypothetical protein
MMIPSQRLQTIATTIPTITRIPPSPIPAVFPERCADMTPSRDSNVPLA